MPEEERPEPSEWYVETDEPVEIIISYEVPLKPNSADARRGDAVR